MRMKLKKSGQLLLVSAASLAVARLDDRLFPLRPR